MSVRALHLKLVAMCTPGQLGLRIRRVPWAYLIALIIFADPLKAEVTIYDSWNIPEFVKPEPNLETLRFYLKRSLDDPDVFDKWTVTPAKNPKQLNSNIQKNSFLSKQMETSSIVSYLYYDNGKIIYDEKSDPSRLGDMVDDHTKLLSNSMGKSLVSYILGHAICEGFIDGIDAKINDWPLIEDTLYHNQNLIDLLNMRARDNEYVNDKKGMLSTGRWYNVHSIKSFAERELKGSKPSPKGDDKYRYSGFVTNIIMNYTIHKTGSDYQNLLNKIFQEKAGIENPVFFFKNKWQRFDDGRINENLPKLKDEDGRAWYMFYAARYDYLRIAKAVLDDWKNDTCVGSYLKEIYKNRKAKNLKYNHSILKHSSHYGGQFHTNFTGMRERKVMSMQGYGGQEIMIDFDNSRIVVLNTVHDNYDWYELVLQTIKNGDIRN